MKIDNSNNSGILHKIPWGPLTRILHRYNKLNSVRYQAHSTAHSASNRYIHHTQGVALTVWGSYPLDYGHKSIRFSNRYLTSKDIYKIHRTLIRDVSVRSGEGDMLSYNYNNYPECETTIPDHGSCSLKYIGLATDRVARFHGYLLGDIKVLRLTFDNTRECNPGYQAFRR